MTPSTWEGRDYTRPKLGVNFCEKITEGSDKNVAWLLANQPYERPGKDSPNKSLSAIYFKTEKASRMTSTRPQWGASLSGHLKD